MSHTAVQTNAFYPGIFRAEYSLDGSTWTAISNAIVLVEGSELTRDSDATRVGGSTQVPVVTVGKFNEVTVKLRMLYLDNDANAPDRVLLNRFRSATPTLALRWKPRGDQTGVTVFATSTDGVTIGLVPIVSVTTPELDPNSTTAAMFELQLIAPTIISYLAGSSTGLGS